VNWPEKLKEIQNNADWISRIHLISTTGALSDVGVWTQKAREDIPLLLSRIAELTEALEFYADPYFQHPADIEHRDGHSSEAEDFGTRARAVLNKPVEEL
jgi:hypothetical protein